MAGLVKTIADFKTTLALKVVAGDTTATLTSATDSDGVALPAGNYGFTVDRNSTGSKEYFTCTLLGTALTNIKTVARADGAETAGFARSHRKGAEVIISDYVAIKRIQDVLESGYASSTIAVSSNQLMTREAVLAVVNGGAVSIDHIVMQGTAGETFSANQIVYLKASDSRWYKLLANDATLLNTAQVLQYGIALSAGSAGAAISSGVATQGYISGLSGLTANNLYYVSDTGTFSTTPGTYSIPLGWAISTSVLILGNENPNTPTPGEKAALAGAQSTPGSTNKYLTQDQLTLGTTDQSQATQNGTSAVGEANTTGLRKLLAQSFIPTKTKIRGVTLYKAADTGSFSGTVKVALQADSAGAPSGSDLASVTVTNAVYLAMSTGAQDFIFSSEYTSLAIGSLYWIVITPSTSDTSNHPNLGTNTAGGYSSGSAKYNNTTDGWVAISTIDLYFKTLEGVTTQIVETNSSGYIPLNINLPMRDRIFLYEGTKNDSDATNTVTVTHGLGYMPTFVRVRAVHKPDFNNATGIQYGESYGVAKIASDGTPTYAGAWSWILNNGNGSGAAASDRGNLSGVGVMKVGLGGDNQIMTISNVRTDKIDLVLTKNGSGTPGANSNNTIYYVVEIMI